MDIMADLDALVGDGFERVPDAGKFLKMCTSQVYILMARGDLPYVKIGRCRRIPRRALLDLAKRSLVTSVVK